VLRTAISGYYFTTTYYFTTALGANIIIHGDSLGGDKGEVYSRLKDRKSFTIILFIQFLQNIFKIFSWKDSGVDPLALVVM